MQLSRPSPCGLGEHVRLPGAAAAAAGIATRDDRPAIDRPRTQATRVRRVRRGQLRRLVHRAGPAAGRLGEHVRSSGPPSATTVGPDSATGPPRNPPSEATSIAVGFGVPDATSGSSEHIHHVLNTSADIGGAGSDDRVAGNPRHPERNRGIRGTQLGHRDQRISTQRMRRRRSSPAHQPRDNCGERRQLHRSDSPNPAHCTQETSPRAPGFGSTTHHPILWLTRPATYRLASYKCRLSQYRPSGGVFGKPGDRRNDRAPGVSSRPPACWVRPALRKPALVGNRTPVDRSGSASLSD